MSAAVESAAISPDRVFTTGEIASILKLSESFINKLRREGKLKAIKIGRSVRITAGELNRMLGEAA